MGDSHGVACSDARGVSHRVRRLRQLCAFISSSFKICSFLHDLPTELRWQAVLAEVSEDDGDEKTDKLSTASTALQSLNQLVTSAKDDVEQRIRGVMSRAVDALAICVRRKTAAVTSACSTPTPWHDVSHRCKNVHVRIFKKR